MKEAGDKMTILYNVADERSRARMSSLVTLNRGARAKVNASSFKIFTTPQPRNLKTI